MFDSPLSDFSSLNFSTAEAVIENVAGCTKNPCGSSTAEVFWFRQMIFRPSLSRVFFLTVTQGDFSSFAFFITTFYAMLEYKKERCFTGKFYIQRRDMR